METIKATIRFIIAFVFVYLLFSFGAWELNPGKWEEFTRGMFCFTGTCIAGLSAAIPIINESIKNNP